MKGENVVKKKLVAALLACTLMGSSFIYASGESKQLEGLIKSVKQKVDIPSDLTEFSFAEYDGIYELTWSDKEGEDSVSVSCETDGDITSYSCYEYNKPYSSVAKVDYSEAEKVAKDFVKKLLPKYADQLEVIPQSSPDNGYEYMISFALIKEKVPVYQHTVDVYVNKSTGIVGSVYGFTYDDAAKYNSATPKITEEAAQKAFLNEISLAYETYWDREDKINAFLAYSINSGDEKGVDAQTGKLVKKYYEGDGEPALYSNVMTQGSDAGSSKDEGISKQEEPLTPEEEICVDEAMGMLTNDQIQAKMSVYFPAIKEMKITSSSTMKSTDGEYERSLSLVDEKNSEYGADLVCNAKTGELLNYCYYYPETGAKDKGTSWTTDQAMAFIKKIAPTYSSEVKLDSSESYEEDGTQYFYFQRQHKDVPVSGNGIGVYYDEAIGQVTSCYCYKDNGLSFPDTADIKHKDEIIKNIGLKLYYMETAAHQYSLVYTIDDYYARYDAKTGEMLDYEGKPITEGTKGFYTDVAGHPYQDVITNLYNSGIYLEGPKLHPNDPITQGEMLRLLLQATAWYENDERAYEDAKELEIIDEEKDTNKKLTKAEGIRYLINAIGYKDVAQLSQIYKYPFDETKVNEEMKGYIAIAYGLGYIKDDKNFDPGQSLTKAEAMQMLYTCLVQRDNK